MSHDNEVLSELVTELVQSDLANRVRRKVRKQYGAGESGSDRVFSDELLPDGSTVANPAVFTDLVEPVPIPNGVLVRFTREPMVSGDYEFLIMELAINDVRFLVRSTISSKMLAVSRGKRDLMLQVIEQLVAAGVGKITKYLRNSIFSGLNDLVQNNEWENISGMSLFSSSQGAVSDPTINK